MSSGGLTVRHLALCAKPKAHRFNPIKRSKLFQGLISRLNCFMIIKMKKILKI